MSQPRSPLNRQTLVITGASSGIGLATARKAARYGAKLVLVARSADVLETEVRSIVAAGGQAISVVADVGSREAVQRAAEKAIDAFGGFDTWVNVAGATIYGHLWQVSEPDSERLMRTNFWGTVNGSLVALDHLKRRGGTLINMGSIASDIAFPLQGMYCATKHAVKGFTDSLRMELLQNGFPVAVTLIKPASINTPITSRARNYMDREPSLPPPMYPPEEVASAILHAAVYPRREIYVGGAAPAFVGLRTFAPSVYDKLAPAITAFEYRRQSPRNPAGTLDTPQGAGQIRGDDPRPIMPMSAYTRATLAPWSTAAAAVAITGAVAGLIVGRAVRRRR